MNASARPTERAWPWFVAWLAVGGGGVLTILGAFTIGLLVLPMTLVVAALLARNRHASQGVLGIVSGLGLPLLYVAYLNRDGPGNICTASRGGFSCTEESNPLTWLALGAALVFGGVLAFVLSRRRARELARLWPS